MTKDDPFVAKGVTPDKPFGDIGTLSKPGTWANLLLPCGCVFTGCKIHTESKDARWLAMAVRSALAECELWAKQQDAEKSWAVTRWEKEST